MSCESSCVTKRPTLLEDCEIRGPLLFVWTVGVPMSWEAGSWRSYGRQQKQLHRSSERRRVNKMSMFKAGLKLPLPVSNLCIYPYQFECHVPAPVPS